MYKTLMLVAVLLISAAALSAQQASQSDSEQKLPRADGLTTLDGCLSSDVGQYLLTEDNGTQHRLSGAAKKLRPLVDHQVELAGKPSVRTLDNTPPGGASSVIQQYVFEVKTVQQLADKCTPR